MGVVYEAFDDEREGVVALKTLRAIDADARLRFKTEFRALQDLQHANLVQLGELIEAEGQLFFTMELVQGVDFLSYVRKDGAPGPHSSPDAPTTTIDHALPAVAPPPRRPGFDEPRLRAALSQLARGLAALHAAGKVHRDIKPSNILVSDAGRVVLLDFGLVEDVAGQKRTSSLLAGTAAFMAPEQYQPHVPAGPACDWYSVGVLLYLALTGRLPFDGPPDVVRETK